MPKATRGRRPLPNPKKRSQRTGPRPITAGSAVQDRPEGAGPAVAPRPARVSSPWPSGPRRSVATAVRRPFSESAADYAYVAADLRRIGVLVGGLVVFMIALSFVIR